jgi:hypothetical protein
MTKKPNSEFADDLQFLEENTQATDIFRLARSRKFALEQKSPSYRSIKWLTAGAFSTILAFSLMVPFDTDSLSTDNSIDKALHAQSDTDESVEELYEEDFYYWLDIYQTELLVSND